MVKDYKENLWLGTDIVVNDYITIKQPTLRQIFGYAPKDAKRLEDFDTGEFGYYKMISTLTSTPADYDVQLDTAGIRYEDVDPMEFFFSLVQSLQLTPDITYPIFGDLDFTKFEKYENEKNKQTVFIDPFGHKIDKPIYMHITSIVRDMHNLSVNQTKWENETSRKMHMDYERKRAQRKHHDKPKHILIPIISMLINTPGFKYNREQCMDLNIYFIYDCLKQIYHFEQVDHLMTGVYVGLIDTKKMNLEESLNMLRKDF